ncbi:acyl-CoA dehydrogenase family protein [Bailinhaonella thermotolerans]|uniref:Acyl-CoA dehydrogenase n=1 Tax=Bailinhaonella thermotolerans TaxID=1070861 RepID=A0A3A4BHL7_9ACTN|nr:acyl-CoA dehydrogenase family protein [Bailinhaonella thermotolerans]RJL34292.1 acyl-CoA dehydrogenase [Bailinhaonella thermotolerans]
MKLVLTSEQNDLRQAVRSFLSATLPPGRVREVMEAGDGYDRAAYDRMNGELGLSGLVVPEEYGGAGAGHAELAVVLEELGAALLPGPFLATTLATLVLLESGDAGAAKDHLPGIAEGRVRASFAPSSADGSWWGAPSVTAAEAGGGHVLDGVAPYVLNGADADLLVVPARLGGRTRLFVTTGGERAPLTTLDLTRRQARVEFAAAPARLVEGDGLARALDLASVAVAAEQLGVLRASLAAITEYAGIRVAFGRYIGSYQGVKHRLADMHCALEQAESVVRHAAWAAGEAPGELPAAAALAQAYTGRACFQVAKDHLLLYGGIGFTWEHDAHLYYKRAKSLEVLLGPPRAHRARLADLVL